MLTPTWSVGELHEAVNGVLEHVLGDLTWVEGELRNLSRSRAGHVYFDLLDATWDGPDGSRPLLAVTLFNSERIRVNDTLKAAGGAVRMTDGIRIRLGGRLRTYPVRSTLQLLMDRIDPAFTLGVLGQERAQLLERLRSEGLLRSNADRELSDLPLHVALVTASGSAAEADALDELRRSGFGFRVRMLDARTQGRDAPDSIVAALRTAETLGVDVVVLVRGGGAATDLAAFDHESVARTIASLSVPVLTGVGHETDRTVADDVSHTAHKTPTAAAAAVVEAVGRARLRVHDAAVRVSAGAAGHLGRADQRLGRCARRYGERAARTLAEATAGIDELDRRARVAGRRATAPAASRVEDLGRRLAAAAVRSTGPAADRVEVLAARARVHDPAVALARGWSITRRADGALLRAVGDVEPGTVLLTTVADGTVRSVSDGTGSSDGIGTRPPGDERERS